MGLLFLADSCSRIFNIFGLTTTFAPTAQGCL